MNLIINIPDNYDLSKIQNGSIASKIILNAVANGTPVKTGYWMDSSNGCTCCESIRDNISDTRYCPNCGAKME